MPPARTNIPGNESGVNSPDKIPSEPNTIIAILAPWRFFEAQAQITSMSPNTAMAIPQMKNIGGIPAKNIRATKAKPKIVDRMPPASPNRKHRFKIFELIIKPPQYLLDRGSIII